MALQNSPVQYAYAINIEGQLVHINDATRSDQYTCPGCRSALTPVMGDVKSNHYRHKNECCSLETYLHKSAKEAFLHRYKESIANAQPVVLELERTIYCNSLRSNLISTDANICAERVPARYNLAQFFNHAELEQFDTNTGMRPDVMLSDTSSEKHCYIEICVTHPCTQEKIDTGIPILEFMVQSVSDIQMLLSGNYSISDERLKVFNWQPPSKTVSTCNGSCTIGNTEMSVWSMSQSGRLHEKIMTLSEVNLTSDSCIHIWPKSQGATQLWKKLRAFIRQVDPDKQFPNCLMCNHSEHWDSGYLSCKRKQKSVPYTEARQCSSYEGDQ